MQYQPSQIDLPKSELISKLKDYINDAQSLPPSELHRVGDYENQPELRYPQTKSEYLVHKMLTLMLSQSWLDAETEPVLDEMTSILGQLDTGVNKPEDWHELFRLADRI